MQESSIVTITLDKRLIEQGLQITGVNTHAELINRALNELIRHHQQRKLLELQGAINWESDIETMRSA